MRQLAYIVPRLEADASDHFAAIPQLLRLMSRSARVVLIAENSECAQQIPGVARTDVVGERRILRRVLRTVRLLEHCRAEGVKTYFVRVSRVAALVAGLWCRIRGGHLYYWHSGAVTYRPMKSVAHLKDWLWSGLPAGLAFRLCHRLVTGPQSMVAHYIREFGVPARKIIVLPNDVDVERFFPASAPDKVALRARMGISGKRVIVMVHRLSPIRRLHQYLPGILQALAAHPSWTLWIVGDGPEREVLENIVAEANAKARVHFVGNVGHSQIPHYLRAADVFANPSYVEGFPRVVIEAMACGLPMVVTDAGGTADLLPESLRNWVTPRDLPDAFAAALGRLLESDESDLSIIGKTLVKYSQRYSTEAVAGEYIRVLFDDRSGQRQRIPR